MATDNSRTVTVSRATGSSSGSRFDQGTYTIVYQATDPTGNSLQTCTFAINVQVKQDTNTISLRGQLILDVVRGFNGIFADASRQDNLEDDLDDLFRGTSLSGDFVGIQVSSSSFNPDDNFVIDYTLHLCKPSHYNEEDIRQIFNSALSGTSFQTANTIVSGSFDLNVVEYRGRFVLRSIVSPGTSLINFQDCCTDPSSASYQNLLTRIYDHLDRTYADLDRFRMVKILFLYAGSVGVRYTLTFDGSTTTTANSVENTFNTSVTPNTLELTDNGVQTALFIEPGGVTAGNTEGICPGTNYCQNGGTCSITNTTSYEFACSCPAGYTGNQCQTMPGVLSTEAIIGIVAGVIGFLFLLLLLVCCCCWCFVTKDKKYDHNEYVERDSTYGRRRPLQQAPLILMPRPQEEYVYDNKRAAEGPIITEVLDEVRVDGPSFYHEDPDYAPPARLMTAPVPYRQRLRAMLPGRFAYPERENNGPRFHSDGIPEPVGDMKRRLFHEFSY